MSKLTIGRVLNHKASKPEQPRRYWNGDIRPTDDLGVPITTTFFDGATVFGPWAIMAPSTHKRIGKGEGIGRGQRYEKQSDGRWMKVNND